jgi:hypothetical protein
MLVRKAKSEDLNSILEFQLAMAKETEGIDLERSTLKKELLLFWKILPKEIIMLPKKTAK